MGMKLGTCIHYEVQMCVTYFFCPSVQALQSYLPLDLDYLLHLQHSNCTILWSKLLPQFCRYWNETWYMYSLWSADVRDIFLLLSVQALQSYLPLDLDYFLHLLRLNFTILWSKLLPQFCRYLNETWYMYLLWSAGVHDLLSRLRL